MTAVARFTVDAADEAVAWIGVAAAGWLVVGLVVLVAVWQAARADRLGVRAAETAHELRGPLCAARLALARLERTCADAPRLVRGLAAIDLELHRAGLALDELGNLDASRDAYDRSAARARREPVDLEALAGVAEPAWQALAAAHDTTLELRTAGAPAVVTGDPRRLLQAIGNLVANACEHGRGPVRVTIAGHAAGARVEVADEGAGPPAAILERASRRARGHWTPGIRDSPRGHGMAIVARVARDGGGRLHARVGGEGAVVILELPLGRPAGVAPRSRVGEAIHGGRRGGHHGPATGRRPTPVAKR